MMPDLKYGIFYTKGGVAISSLVFQNYHRHSFYTNPIIPDSVVSNEAYASRAKELGHGIISTMEHGNQGRYIEGYNLSKKYDLKFLFGTEAYWVKDRTKPDGTNCHIYIGARNENGRQAINDVLSEANLTGFYRRARLDIPLILSLPKDDVWVTTACVAYWQYDDAEEITKRFANYFGNNFYLEVQYHNTPKQEALNRRILKLRDELKLPIIMGCDSHYIFQEKERDRVDFLASKEMHYDDEDGWFMDYPDGETAWQRFEEQGVLSAAQIEEAMSNTNIFLDVEEYDSDIFNNKVKMPSIYPSLSQTDKDELYESVVWDSWNKYKLTIPEEKWPHYTKEIAAEIKEVRSCGMADYFLLNNKIIRKGKENGGWLTKTGRGSAVSFVTNMLLGFTEVDRVAAKVKMYPERFLTSTRILESGSLPDIDYNVAPVEPFARAQKEILGEDHAYPMISYGTMQSSAAWKLYAKSQSVPFDIANAVSSQIKEYEEAVKQADEDEKENINPLEFIDPQYHEIFEKSADYRGIISSWSIAPCGYLLYQGGIRKQIGLVRIKDHICCMMDGKWAEENHFLKNDLLKVSVVDLIYRTFHRIGMEPPSVNELLEMCPPEDPCWSVYAKSCCLGINQVEKSGTASRVGAYRPTNISELSAFVAAIRPGFKSMYKTFEQRKDFSYGVKAFDDLMRTEEMPQSFCMYQEQEMAALNYAGIPMSECYTAIKNIAKKRKEKVLAYKEKFIPGFVKTLVSDEKKAEEEAEAIAESLWRIVEDSASYLFNSSHSYCVACDSLYSAWLKAHYPVEFYETLLRIYEEKGEKDKMQDAIREASSYFQIHFPPMRLGQDNRSFVGDSATKTITASLQAIKGFGSSVGDTLFECGQQGFTSLMEVFDWLFHCGIRESKILPLIKIGYFDNFGNQRELMRMLEFFLMFWQQQDYSKQISREGIDGTALEPIVSKYANGLLKTGVPAKRYKILNPLAILKEIETLVLSLNMADLPDTVKIRNYNDVTGSPNYISGKDADRRKLYIVKCRPVKRKSDGKQFGYNVLGRSIGSGKETWYTILNRYFNKEPIKEGDIILCLSFEREKSFFNITNYKKIA